MFELAQISARIPASGRALICVDGPAGAGKTTLASQLVNEFPGANVVHMDDLYDGWDNALSDDLAQRLVEHVRDPFLTGSPIRFRRYDWYAGGFGDEHVELPDAPLLIVEGVGAAQAAMRAAAAVTVFIDIDPTDGRARVIARDGAASIGHIEAWQAHEQTHFRLDRTRESVHVVLTA